MCNRRRLSADDHAVIRVETRNAICGAATAALASASEGIDKLAMYITARVASTRAQILEAQEPQITARALELLQRRRR